MKEIRIEGVLVKFDESYNSQIIERLESELNNAIKDFKKILEERHVTYVPHIEIITKKIEDGLKINGSFSYRTRIIKLQYNDNDNDNFNKFRQTCVHELCHAKFNDALITKNMDLLKISTTGRDPAIYIIDEYMACKYSNMNYNNLAELKHINDCQDNFNYYYKDRKISVGASKELATLISMIIISDYILKNNNIKTKGIYNKDIIDIKKILEDIEYTPTSEQYSSMRALLKSKQYKVYN